MGVKWLSNLMISYPQITFQMHVLKAHMLEFSEHNEKKL